jgi:hypothetical protein
MQRAAGCRASGGKTLASSQASSPVRSSTHKAKALSLALIDDLHPQRAGSGAPAGHLSLYDRNGTLALPTHNDTVLR